MSSVQAFCDSTSLHGFTDCYHAKKYWRIFWGVVIVISFIITCIEIYQVINSYVESPTATMIEYVTMESYKLPRVAVCPTKWADGSKIKRLIESKVLSYNCLKYAASLLFIKPPAGGPPPAGEGPPPQSDPQPPLLNETDDQQQQMVLELSNYLKKTNQSIIDFFISLALDSRDILEFKYNLPPQIADSTKLPDIRLQFAGRSAFCFVLNLGEFKQEALILTSYSFFLNINRPDEMSQDNTTAFLSSMFSDATITQPMLFLSNEERVFYGFNMLKMKPNTHYYMQLQASYSKRLPEGHTKCVTLEDLHKRKQAYSKQACLFDCIDQYLIQLGANSCHNLGMSLEAQQSQLTNLHNSVCSGQTRPSTKSNATLDVTGGSNKRCIDSCLPPCDQWHYNYLIFSESMTATSVQQMAAAAPPPPQSNSTTLLELEFNPVDGVVYSQEVFMYGWDTLISNIGGQFGLWMGGSVVSLIQIFYFLTLCLIQKNIQVKLKRSVQAAHIKGIAAMKY